MRKILTSSAGVMLLTGGAAAHASGAGESAGELHLVPMEKIEVPVVEGSRADGALQLKLVLVAQDAVSASDAEGQMPRLRATSVSTALEFARLYASPTLPVDVKRLSEAMTSALHEVDPRISRVLIVEVMARRA